jgi:hypothetical protein
MKYTVKSNRCKGWTRDQLVSGLYVAKLNSNRSLAEHLVMYSGGKFAIYNSVSSQIDTIGGTTFNEDYRFFPVVSLNVEIEE